MIERSRVRIPAGTAGEFSSPGSTFCADSYFGIHCSNSFGEAVPLRDGTWEQGLLLELGPVEGHVKGTGAVGVVITSWSQVYFPSSSMKLSHAMPP